MSENQNPQLPPNPDEAIEVDDSLHATTDKWFEYPVLVHPHHTDYAGIVWHGNYIKWMEEARIEYLNSIGLDYTEIVSHGFELPVVEVNLRYHQSLKMGDKAIVKTRLHQLRGVRMNFEYQITNLRGSTIYVSGKVVLVGIDREKGKIMRQLPSILKNALVKL